MSFVFKHTTPENHQQYTAVKEITMTCRDEASLTEMTEAFNDFLRACGYSVGDGIMSGDFDDEYDAEAMSDSITREYSQPDYSKDLMSVFDEKM